MRRKYRFMQEIRSLATIQTPDQVTLSVELAGVGGRIFAFLIDFVLILFLMGLFILVLFIVSTVFVNLGLSRALAGEGLNTIAPLTVLVFLFGIHIVQEWLGRGRTLGKSFMGIRVVRDNGQPIGFWEAFGRNLFRLVDVYIAGIGLFPLLISRSEKRFGDYLVGTIVVQEDALKYHYHPLQFEKQPLPSESLGGRELSVEEYQLLQSFLNRQGKLIPGDRARLDQELRDYFGKRLDISPEGSREPAFLSKLLEQYRV